MSSFSNIQLALRRAGVVVLWESEPEVRAVNDFTTDRYAKDYDAVVTFRSGHRCGKMAVEYERTRKSSKAYKRICSEIDQEMKLDACLYLVPNHELQRSCCTHCARRGGGSWSHSRMNSRNSRTERRSLTLEPGSPIGSKTAFPT